MTMFRITAAIGALFLALVAFAALSLSGGTSNQTALAAPGQKVDVCHQTGSETNPWVAISVNENAVDKHVENHGDFVFSTAVSTPGSTAPTPTPRPCPPATATPTAAAGGG